MRIADGRKRAVVGLSAGAMLGLAAFAPSAWAQTDPMTDAVGSATTTVTDTTQTVSESVKEVIGDTRGTVGSTTRKVTEVTDPVGSAVDDATGTDTYKTTKGTLHTTADSADQTIDEVTGPVHEKVEETTGGLGNDPKPNRDTPRGRQDGENPAPGTPRSRVPASGSGRIAVGAATGIDPLNRLAAVTASEGNRGIGPSAVTSAVTTPQPQGGSLFRELVEGAGEAAKKLAFPLALALMVAAFLIVQGRIDRQDAKLALAPIDAEQDLLSFQ